MLCVRRLLNESTRRYSPLAGGPTLRASSPRPRGAAVHHIVSQPLASVPCNVNRCRCGASESRSVSVDRSRSSSSRELPQRRPTGAPQSLRNSKLLIAVYTKFGIIATVGRDSSRKPAASGRTARTCRFARIFSGLPARFGSLVHFRGNKRRRRDKLFAHGGLSLNSGDA